MGAKARNHGIKKGGIWVHAVSVGEAIAAIKLIKALQEEYPEQSMTVTCGTPTGSEIIQNQLGSSVFHVYFPYDYPGSVRRFLSVVKPRLGIIMETELWPNLFHKASSSGVKILISNMRLSDGSFKNYQKFSKLASSTFEQVDQFLVQTETDAKRAIVLGAEAEKVSIVGNLKFDLDRAGLLDKAQKAILQTQFNLDRLTWLAGSTHAGEDEIILSVHQQLLKTWPNLLLIIAPRHPERFETVLQLAKQSFNTQKRSLISPENVLASTTQVLIADSMGELNQFIQISDWAFIGGSLVPVGGHNILEACAASVPVIFGQHMQNFRQIAQRVKIAEAGIQVSDELGLCEACKAFAAHSSERVKMGQNGRVLMAQHQGTLGKTMILIKSLMS